MHAHTHTPRANPIRAILNCTLVWIMNFAGSLFVAWTVYETEVFEGPFLDNCLGYTEHKVHQSFGTAFVKAIYANWFVALAVLLASGAHDMTGKVRACVCVLACGRARSVCVRASLCAWGCLMCMGCTR